MCGGGTVTVPANQTYNAYKIFDIEYNDVNNTTNESPKKYTINKDGKWATHMFGSEMNNSVAENMWFTCAPTQDVNVFEVTWKNGTKTDSDVRAAAEWLKGLAETKTIDADKVLTTEDNTLSNNGYYLIYSPTLGTAGLALANSNNTITLETKVKGNPEITKKIVSVNGDQSKAGASATASVGDTISFEIKVTIPGTTPKDGTGNIVVIDKSDEGLEIQKDTVKCIQGVDTDVNSKITGTASATGFTFTVLNAEIADSVYKITYDAILTGAKDEAQKYINKYNNTAEMTFNSVSTKVAASVLTNLSPEKGEGEGGEDGKGNQGAWSLLKVDSAKKYLKGAKFEIHRQSNGQMGEAISFTYDTNSKAYIATTGSGSTVIDLTCPDAIGSKGPKETENPNVMIQGLAGKVYVKEIKAPAGYNALTAPIVVDLDRAENVSADGSEERPYAFPGICNALTGDSGNSWQASDKGLAIENSTGTLLPSTGGIGTTIFYIAGAILLLGAVVVLIVRRRMNEDN